MKKWSLLVPVAVGLVIASLSIYTVDENEVVLLTQFGEIVGLPVTEPGRHLKLPVVQQAVAFQLGPHDWRWQGRVASRDQKIITLSVSAQWRIVDPKAFYVPVRNRAGAEARLDGLLPEALRNHWARVASEGLQRAPEIQLQQALEDCREVAVLLGIELLELQIEE